MSPCKMVVLGLALAALAACGDDDATTPEPRRESPESIEPPAAGPAEEEAAERSPRPSQAERASAARLLAEGRRLVRADRYAEALAKLREALELVPGDGTLLCEAGWAAFLAEDDAAGELLRLGTSLQSDPPKRAACIYNRGRLAEREAERAEGEEAVAARERAIALYADSLALRPGNAATRRRYEALRGEAARPPEGCPPSNTFADVEAYCRALPLIAEDEAITECGAADLPVTPEGEGAGDLVLVGASGDYAALTTYHLLLRTDGGLEPLVVLGFDHERSCSSSVFAVQSLRWIPAEPRPTLLVRSQYSETHCSPTDWDRCIGEGGTEASCADESDEVEMQESTETYRELCAAEDVGYRCTSGASILGPDIPRASTDGPIPEGDALERLLRCP